MNRTMTRISLQRGLFALIALALVAGLLPAGFVLDRRLAAELEARAREDLALAPRLFEDRETMRADAMMMHAKELAGSPELVAALRRGDRPAASRVAERLAASFGETAVLIVGDGAVWLGQHPGRAMLAATRAGRAPVALRSGGDTLRRIALAPVSSDGGAWLGAAGVSAPLDDAAAATFAGLTRSEVLILGADAGTPVSTLGEATASRIARGLAGWPVDGVVRELRSDADHRRYLVTLAPLEGAGRVAFVRDLEAELAVLPQLRRVAALAAAFALVIALGLGAVFASVLSRPVRSLAQAADRLAAGDFEAPVSPSAIREVDRVGRAFVAMRRSLAARVEELEAANRELAERQRRLSALQAELIQRDRLAATGRLVTELAHEVRNPVANVRNCLEVISRRLDEDETARQFADLAIDELLRMHELAERMLDINRPREAGSGDCDAAAIAREVAALVKAGTPASPLVIETRGASEARALIPPDALKQVLLNLVQNAREAAADAGRIEIGVAHDGARVVIDVVDDGPGIPEEVLARVFDPFFTTKGAVQGVGLGLYVAEGIVRTHGGGITATNRDSGRGAHFRIELRAASTGGPAVPAATDKASEGG